MAAFATLRQRGGRPRHLLLHAAITIQARPEEVFDLWRDPAVHSQLRQAAVMRLEGEAERLHWRRELPGGGRVEGEVHVTRAQAPERIEWVTENLRLRLRPGVPVRRLGVRPRGLLHLRPLADGQATEARLSLQMENAPPLPWLSRRIRMGLRSTLRRLRALAETGELATIAGQPSGHRHGWVRTLLPPQHEPAVEPEPAERAG
ncbi:MAG TPA: SRPBCC family protein [Terriglobales bacterium]|nr:SRPBCC family protein [Terriglobales bacterium]